VPSRAIILARISDARDGDERGVSDQLGDGLRLAERLGWGVGPADTHHIVENDVSAFKRRKVALPDGRHELRTVRPGFRSALAMLADGRADALIAYDLDRAVRDPRDLEDLIDVVEAGRPRLPVESVTGSLRLANDADVTMARVMVAVGNKASRDTARRVARARLRQATAGEYGGGKRRYGFERDGTTIREDEAAEIRRAAEAILAGVSLRQVTASLRDRHVPTVTGAAWDATTLKDILMRPRNCGLMVHRPAGSERDGPPYSDDEIVGTAPGEPIISDSSWRAVCAILNDPARRLGAGRVPRYLGSRIYFCGKCDDGTTLVTGRSEAGLGRHTRYTCSPDRQLNDLPSAERRWHLGRAALMVDEFVEAALVARLSRPDAADLIPAEGEVDARAMREEASSLRELLDDLARSFARRRIDRRQMEAGSAELRARLTEVDAALAVAAATSPLSGIAGRPDAVEVWAALDVGRKRAMLRALADVTLLPALRRGPGFDSRTVDIDFTKRMRSKLGSHLPP
jgi:site-specific DNA recombinase